MGKVYSVLYYTSPVNHDYLIRLKSKSYPNSYNTFENFIGFLIFNKLDNEYDESDFRRICGISHDIIYNDKDDYRLKYLYRSYRNICNVYRSNERYGFTNGYMEMLIDPYLVQDSKVIDEFNILDQEFLKIVPMIYVNNREEKNKYNLINRILKEIGKNISNVISEINIFLGNPLENYISDLDKIMEFRSRIETYFNLIYGGRDVILTKIEDNVESLVNGVSPIIYNGGAESMKYHALFPEDENARMKNCGDVRSRHDITKYSEKIFKSEYKVTVDGEERTRTRNDYPKMLNMLGFTDEEEFNSIHREIVDVYKSETNRLIRKLKNGVNAKSSTDNVSCTTVLYNIKYYLNIIKRAVKFRIKEFCYRADTNYRYDWRHSKNMAIRWREYFRLNIEDIMGHLNTAISSCKDVVNNKNSILAHINNCANISTYYQNEKAKIDKEFGNFTDSTSNSEDFDDILDSTMEEMNGNIPTQMRERKKKKMYHLKMEVKQKYETIVENLKLSEAVLKDSLNLRA